MKPRRIKPSSALDAIGSLSDVMFMDAGGPIPSMEPMPLAERIEAWQIGSARRDMEELEAARELAASPAIVDPHY